MIGRKEGTFWNTSTENCPLVFSLSKCVKVQTHYEILIQNSYKILGNL